MLIQNLFYYMLAILVNGFSTLAGMVGLVLIFAAIAFLVFKVAEDSRFRLPAFWGALLAGLACLIFAFYSSVYVFDEQPEKLSFASLPSGEPTCGTAQTNWIKAAYGISNPCPWGCYRGKVLSKELRMRGFPPWPEYRRVLQCWTR